MPLDTHSGGALTLNCASRRCWDLVDLGSRQRQLVALQLEGHGFAALARGHRAARQGGQLSDAHHLSSYEQTRRNTRYDEAWSW